MLTYPIVALLLGSSSSSAMAKAGGSPNKPHDRKLLNQKDFQKDLYGNSKRSAALRKKFIAKSTFVGGRKLEEAEAEVDDGYYNEDDAGSVYGFEPGNYALSYHRCAAVRQFDDEIAAEEDSNTVFATKNFAIFRFCPADSCDAEIEVQEDEDAAADDGNGRRLEDADKEEQEEQSYQQANNGEIYGARGKGCRKNYGEYMMELEDYLQIMLEHQQERAAEYCDYCDDYMYSVYQAYVYSCMQSNSCRLRRTLKYEEFKMQDTSMVDQHRELGLNFGICSKFPYVCDGALDDDLTGYFECTEANGAYVGPHCAEDGFTITLGVYADKDCYEYTGLNVTSYIAEDLDDDALKTYYNSRHGAFGAFLYEGQEESVCIPCQKQDVDWANFGNDDDDGGDDADGDDQVDYSEMSDICQQVYDTSARCHSRYRSFKKGNLSTLQWKEMQLSCSFIDSIVMGNYDEMGYVNLRNNWNFRNKNSPEWARDNKYASEYGHMASDVSPLQVFFLVFSMLACGILAVWSKTLHTSLTGKEPWAPRRVGWNANNIFRKQDRQGISPADSGIEASRVRSDKSDASAYYLT